MYRPPLTVRPAAENSRLGSQRRAGPVRASMAIQTSSSQPQGDDLAPDLVLGVAVLGQVAGRRPWQRGPAPEKDAWLDRLAPSQPAGRGQLDLAGPRGLHPVVAGPPPGHRPAPARSSMPGRPGLSAIDQPGDGHLDRYLR